MKLCKLVTSWCRNFELRTALPIAMSVLSSMLMSTAQVQAQSIHNVWYVSKAPGSMPSDGRSWRSAWRELDQILWDSVQPGDTIVIDGGTSSMIYSTPLRVQRDGSPTARITIKQSTQAGHNGQIVIHNCPIGIAIQNRSFISVIGARWRGIVVESCSDAGISVYGSNYGGMAVSNLLKNIEVRNCAYTGACGIAYGGQQLTLNQVIAHDNYHFNLKAVYEQSFGVVNGLSMKRCWIYNQTAQSDGLFLAMEGSQGPPKMYVGDCIFGPGLVNNAQVAGRANLVVDGALFINGSEGNLKSSFGSNSSIVMRNTTSFLTRLNAQGQAHSFINAPGQFDQIKINKSVVYGGAVLLKAGRVGSMNTQFRTSGNTTALSDRMVDPKFQANVGAYPDNVSTGTLINTDFALSLGSPAAGTGARITSVKQLISSP